MKNLQEILQNRKIQFETEKKAINWIKSLQPKSLVKIGQTYFIDEQEIEQLIENYFIKQISLRKKRAAQARKNFTKRDNSRRRLIEKNKEKNKEKNG